MESANQCIVLCERTYGIYRRVDHETRRDRDGCIEEMDKGGWRGPATIIGEYCRQRDVHVSDLGTAAEMWKKFRMVKEPSSRLAARKNCIEPLLKRETTSPNTSSKSRQLEKNSMQWVYRSKTGISLKFSWLRCLNPGMYSRLLTWMHTTLV